MNIQAHLNVNNMTMYKLSKISGVPKTTVIDICAGRSSLQKCSAKTVLLLSRALGCTMEELLEDEEYSDNGKPTDKEYLERNLPEVLQTSLETFKKAKEKILNGATVQFFDCYYCELQSDINSAQVSGMISSEQAWYLREKYLEIER